MQSTDRYINLKEVLYQTGLSKSTVYFMMKLGRFPSGVTIGRRAVRWRQSEVDDFKHNPKTYGFRKALEQSSKHLGDSA